MNKKLYVSSYKDVARLLRVDYDRGLTDGEAKKRLRRFRNVYDSDGSRFSYVKVFLSQLKSPFSVALIISSIVSFFIGHSIEAWMILAILLVNSIIGFVYEVRSKKIINGLYSTLKFFVVVLRDGIKRMVDSSDITIGDVVFLKDGDKVPADIKIVETFGDLRVDESSISGESDMVAKRVVLDDNRSEGFDVFNMKDVLFSGSYVVSGSCKGIVIGVGDNTFFASTANMAVDNADDTPLNNKIKDLSVDVMMVVFGVVILAFGIGLLAGIETKILFLLSISLLVSMVPEGLPILTTLALAVGVKNMRDKNVLVRNMFAVEGLSGVDVVAMDKTGTITQNRLRPEVILLDTSVAVIKDGRFYNSRGRELDIKNAKDLMHFGWLATLASNVEIVYENNKRVILGDPTERSILRVGELMGYSKNYFVERFRLVDSIPFSFETKFFAGLYRLKKDEGIIIATGAPEAIFKMCTKQGFKGKKLDLKKWNKRLHNFADKGYRMIGVAYKKTAASKLDKTRLKDMHFAGLICIRDTIREGISDTIQQLRGYGIETMMITGDKPDTALGVAREIGLANDEKGVVAGVDVRTMIKNNKLEGLDKIRVIARATPSDKLAIIDAFQDAGYDIAMTGDGVNDAPALVSADIGLAMASGADITIESADLVLMDDNINSLVPAVEEARNVFNRIKSITVYLFSSNIGEALLVILGMLFLSTTIFNPVQIIWINMVTDSFLVSPLIYAQLRSRGKSNKYFDTLLDKVDFYRILAVGVYMAIASFIVFLVYRGVGETYASTLSVSLIIFMQMSVVWTLKTNDYLWKKFKMNWGMLYMCLLVLVLQTVAIMWEPLREILGFSVVDWTVLLFMFIISSTVIGVDSLFKYFIKKKF